MQFATTTGCSPETPLKTEGMEKMPVLLLQAATIRHAANTAIRRFAFKVFPIAFRERVAEKAGRLWIGPENY